MDVKERAKSDGLLILLLFFKFNQPYRLFGEATFSSSTNLVHSIFG